MRVLLALFLLVSTAFAQQQQQTIPGCGKHDDMVKELRTKAREFQVGVGLDPGNGSILEVYASEAGTFTILVTTMIDGRSCIKAFGTNFQTRLPPWKEQGA